MSGKIVKELSEDELEGITGGSNNENVQLRAVFLQKFGSKMTDEEKASALSTTGEALAKSLMEDLNSIPGIKVSLSATGGNTYSYNGETCTHDQFMAAMNNLKV